MISESLIFPRMRLKYIRLSVWDEKVGAENRHMLCSGTVSFFFFFVWHIARVGVCNTHGLAICFVLVHPQGIKSLGVISCIIC
jgi:hypothetical protein